MRVPIGQKIALESYEGSWPPDDPDAGFRRLVAEYSRIDPLPTLDVLSRNKGIPVGALVRFVLARYCTSGSDALLEMGPRVVRQMDAIVREAEAVGTDVAPWRPMTGQRPGELVRLHHYGAKYRRVRMCGKSRGSAPGARAASAAVRRADREDMR